MQKQATRSRQGIQSIEIGGRLLGALAAAARPMMLKELAAAGHMSAPKAHRYLVSLVRTGLVEQEAGTGRYDLGAFALELGLAGLARLDPVRLGLEAIERLRDEIDVTVALAVWANRGATIIRWLESSHPVNAALRAGAVLPLTRSATGRSFLAFLAPAATAPLVKAELASNAREGIGPRTHAEVDRLVADTRARGLARAEGELVDGISGLAAPVFDANGSMVLAMIALGYSGGFDARWEGGTAKALREAAAGLSRRLGFRNKETGVRDQEPGGPSERSKRAAFTP
jgi:DNA-binding IclR family transcriptional regulator